MTSRRRTLISVMALSLGAVFAGSPHADTTPPRLSLDYPWTSPPYETGGPVLPLIVARASDDLALAEVSWSTDSGGSGPLSYTCEPEWNCWFEAEGLPLVVGTNTITVTARDAAGNSTSLTFTVVARAALMTYHVDCSLAASGDGSPASPFNDLQQAMWASAAGDTIQIDGGTCSGDTLVDHGLTIQGDPGRPHAELDMRGWVMETYTPENFTLRHLRFVEPRPEASPRPPQVLVEDVRDVTLHSWFRNPRYIVRRSEGIHFYAHASGAGIEVDVESSTGLDFSGGCYSGGRVKIRARDSRIDRMWICDHGFFDIEIERSRIEAGAFAIEQYREGGCCTFNLAVRNSEIVGTRLIIDRYSGGFCSGPYPCPIPRGTVLFERNRFVDSSLEVSTSNQGNAATPGPADLIVQNNLFERSGVKIELDQAYASFDSAFGALVRHNTFVDAAVGLDVRGSVIESPPPDWTGEIASNIFTGCYVGLRIHGAGGGALDARIAANDFHDNALDLDLDTGATLEGNLFAPPRFKDPSSGDYSLLPGSVCIDGGADVIQPPAEDILGRPRSLDGDKDGLPRPDIGAWEFVRGRLHRLARARVDQP